MRLEDVLKEMRDKLFAAIEDGQAGRKAKDAFVAASDALMGEGVAIETLDALVDAMTEKPLNRERFDGLVEEAKAQGATDKSLGRLADAVGALRMAAAKVRKVNAGPGFSSAPAPHGPHGRQTGIVCTIRVDKGLMVEGVRDPAVDPLGFLTAFVEALKRAEKNRISLGPVAASWSVQVEMDKETAERAGLHKSDGTSLVKALERKVTLRSSSPDSRAGGLFKGR